MHNCDKKHSPLIDLSIDNNDKLYCRSCGKFILDEEVESKELDRINLKFRNKNG